MLSASSGRLSSKHASSPSPVPPVDRLPTFRSKVSTPSTSDSSPLAHKSHGVGTSNVDGCHSAAVEPVTSSHAQRT